MNNPLAKKINFINLIKFTMPVIFMMMFMSFYTMVDGIFVARFVNTSALSAVNIVYPFVNIIIGFGVMIAAGGSAFVSKQIGEGNKVHAREVFSALTYLAFFVGFTIMLIGCLFAKPILIFLGANDAIMEYCYFYFIILAIFTPFGMLQILFQHFFVTAGKSIIGLISVVCGGFLNLIFDYIFIVPLNMGIAGAALATGIGFSVPSLVGLFYFILNRKGTLYLVKGKAMFKEIWLSLSNGSSEMVTNLSVAVTTFLFNFMMMRYLGENGVAAITIILYLEYLMNAVFLGYSTGVAPLFGFNFGNKNEENLHKLLKRSIFFIFSVSLIVFCVALVFANNLVTIFAPVGSEVYKLALNGMKLFLFAFLFMGTNIFISAMFTALSNGRVSAILSFLRTFLLIATLIVVLPHFLGVNGIWLAVPMAEMIAFSISLVCVFKYRKTYGYLGKISEEN